MRLAIAICVIAFLAASCARVPGQASYPHHYQNKMQSADHWAQLAKNVTKEQIMPFFYGTCNTCYPPNSPIVMSNRAVFIQNKDKSDFGIAFRTYLTSELFKINIPISENEAGAVTVSWSTQNVHHNEVRRNPRAYGGIVGTAIGSVCWLFGGAFYPPYFPVPHSELLITTKVIDGTQTLSRRTQTLYVGDEDVGNYWVISDNDAEMPYAYIQKNSLVCRDLKSLQIALGHYDRRYTSLNTLINERKCAIIEYSYPVTIVQDMNEYLIFKSENEGSNYMTTREAIKPL